jgi:hypothetical protein
LFSWSFEFIFTFRYTPNSNCTWEDKLGWCCSWLYTPRDDGMPRALISEYTFEESYHCYSFIERIKKVIFNKKKEILDN